MGGYVNFSTMKLELLVLVAILLALHHATKDAENNILMYPFWGLSKNWNQTLKEWSSSVWLTSLITAAVTQDILMFVCTIGMFMFSASQARGAWLSCFLGMVGNALSMLAKTMGVESDSDWAVYRMCLIYTVLVLQVIDMVQN